jgi:hypothetical protein
VQGAVGGWRGGAHRACGIHVQPLLHEAGEGGEVALPRRLDKSHLCLRAQPLALSASQEHFFLLQGGEAPASGG